MCPPRSASARARPALRAALALALALVAAPGGRARAFEPSYLPADSVRTEFAHAFHIDASQVVEARAFDLAGDPKHPGFIVGRYRERADTQWVFPGVAVYGPCKLGTCLYRVGLGAASLRLAPIAILDLDAPQTTLERLEPVWEIRKLTPPKTRATWPALVLAAERSVDEPTRTDLIIVSLRTPEPAVLLEHTLESREHEPTDDEMRSPNGAMRPGWVPIGTRCERAAFVAEHGTHAPTTYRLTLTDRAIDSRWNPCLAPEPYPVEFVLRDGRFAEVPAKVPPKLPCH